MTAIATLNIVTGNTDEPTLVSSQVLLTILS
jgi:hypothetical protein